MTRPCPRCKSRSIKYDRSLGGSFVCGGCGVLLGSSRPSRQSKAKGLLLSWGGSSLNSRSVFAWLLPVSLVGSYVYMAANPDSIRKWTLPLKDARQSQGWRIKTPADIELLIEQAQERETTAGPREAPANIRAISSMLISKGVALIVSSAVPAGAEGVWDPGRGEVRITPSAVSMGPRALAEILAHESAHVAQSCRAGGLGKSSEPMGIEVDPVSSYRTQLNSDLYAGPLSSKAIEVEAYSVSLTPDWAPELLDHYCK